MAVEDRSKAYRLHIETDEENVEIMLMPQERILGRQNSEVIIEEDLRDSWLHIRQVGNDSDLQGSLDLEDLFLAKGANKSLLSSSASILPYHPLKWLRLGGKPKLESFSRASKMKQAHVDLLDVEGSTNCQITLQVFLEPTEFPRSAYPEGLWRVVLLSGRVSHGNLNQYDLQFSGALGAHQCDPEKPIRPTEQGKEFTIKQTFTFPGTGNEKYLQLSAHVKPLVQQSFKGSSLDLDLNLEEVTASHILSLQGNENFLTSLKFRANHILSNQSKWGIHVKAHVSFESKEETQKLHIEPSRTQTPGFLRLKKIKLRGFSLREALGSSFEDVSFGMRISLGTSRETISFGLFNGEVWASAKPSRFRRGHDDRDLTLEVLEGSILMTTMYEFETLHVELFSDGNSELGSCVIAAHDNGRWQSTSTRNGQIQLTWEFESLLHTNSTDDIEPGHPHVISKVNSESMPDDTFSIMATSEAQSIMTAPKRRLLITMNRILMKAIEATTLRPAEVFLQLEILRPGNQIGEDLIVVQRFRSQTVGIEEEMAETAQCDVQVDNQHILLKVNVMSIRNVLLGETIIDIGSLVCCQSREWLTVPFHCNVGKFILDLTIDSLDSACLRPWANSRWGKVRSPYADSKVPDVAIIDILNARELRRAKGNIKVTIEETHRKTNAKTSLSIPQGSLANPEWEQETLNFQLEDLARGRLSNHIEATATGPVWLLTARVFADTNILGSVTFLELPQWDLPVEFAFRPLLYRNRLAGFLELASSRQDNKNVPLDSFPPLADSVEESKSSGRESLSSSSVRVRRRSSLASTDSQGDRFLNIRLSRLNGLQSSHRVSVRVKVINTWFMTHFREEIWQQNTLNTTEGRGDELEYLLEMRDSSRSGDISQQPALFIFEESLGPFRIDGSSSSFPLEVTLVECDLDNNEIAIETQVLPVLVLEQENLEINFPGAHAKLYFEVKCYNSRKESERMKHPPPKQQSLYKTLLKLPSSLRSYAFTNMTLSGDFRVECRALQPLIQDGDDFVSLACVGYGEKHLQRSLHSLQLLAYSKDDKVVEGVYEVRNEQLQLVEDKSHAYSVSLPKVLYWSIFEANHEETKDTKGLFLRLNQIKGLALKNQVSKDEQVKCRVTMYLVSALGAKHDAIGISSTVQVQNGAAFFGEHFNLKSSAAAALSVSILVFSQDQIHLRHYQTLPLNDIQSPQLFTTKLKNSVEIDFSFEESLQSTIKPDSKYAVALDDSGAAEIAKALENDPELQPFIDAFRRFDKECKGFISAQHIDQLVHEELAFLLSASSIYDMTFELANLDLNCDGQVSLNEYLAWAKLKRAVTSSNTSLAKEYSKNALLRLELKSVTYSQEVNARVVVTESRSGAKEASPDAKGPHLTWPDPPILELPFQEKITFALIEHHSGRKIGVSKSFQVDRIPNRIDLKGSPLRIRVEVLHARNLRAADTTGIFSRTATSSDPYCIVRVGPHAKQRTRVCQDTCNPDWNEVLEFNFKPGELTEDNIPIKIEVRDKDSFSLMDDRLGYLSINCSKELAEEIVLLQGKGATGTLTLRTSIVKYDTAVLELSSEITTEVTLDSMDLAIRKRTEMINQATRLNEESNKVLQAMPKILHVGVEQQRTGHKHVEGNLQNITELAKLISLAPGMPPERLWEFEIEVQEQMYNFSKAYSAAYASGKTVLDPMQYDFLLQAACNIHVMLRQSRIHDKLSKLYQTNSNQKDAQTIIRELVFFEQERKIFILDQLRLYLPHLNMKDPRAAKIVEAKLFRQEGLPSMEDIIETSRAIEKMLQQRAVVDQEALSLKAWIETKQSDLGKSLGTRRDHLRVQSRADILYAENLVGERADPPEQLREQMLIIEQHDELLRSRDLQDRKSRHHVIETFIQNHRPFHAVELLRALKSINMDIVELGNPVTEVELTALGLYSTVIQNKLTVQDLALRFVQYGVEGLDSNSVLEAINQRLARDERKVYLQEALDVRVKALYDRDALEDASKEDPQDHEDEILSLLLSSHIAKTFIEEVPRETADSLSELARQVAAKIVHSEYLSRQELMRAGGVLQLGLKYGGHDIRASLDGEELPVVPDAASLAEFRIPIPPQDSVNDPSKGVLHLDLLPHDLKSTTFLRIIQHTQDLIRRPGIQLSGQYHALRLPLPRALQGTLHVRPVIGSNSCSFYLRCEVVGQYPLPKFIDEQADCVHIWDLASDCNEAAILFPGILEDQRDAGIKFLAQLFHDRNLRNPVLEQEITELDIQSIEPQAIHPTVRVEVRFKPNDHLFDDVSQHRAAVKMTALARGYLTRRSKQILGYLSMKVSASGVVGAMGSKQASLSTYCTIQDLEDNRELARSMIAKHMGESPAYGSMRFPVLKSRTGQCVFKVWEDSELVGQTQVVEIEQLLSSGFAESKEISLTGGLRSRQGKGLHIHVVRAKVGSRSQKFSVRVYANARGQGNKRETSSVSANQQGVIDWNEGFAFREKYFGVEDSVKFELLSEGGACFAFQVELGPVLERTKFTHWMRSQDNDVALLVKIWTQDTSDNEQRCGMLKLSDINLEERNSDTGSSENVPKDQIPADSLYTPCMIEVRVVEARNFSEGTDQSLRRLKVRCEVLPWGPTRPQGCAETALSWGNNKHIRWTRSEQNTMDLHFSGCNNKMETPYLGVELSQIDQEPLLGYAKIPLLEDVSEAGCMWYDLSPHGQIRLSIRRKDFQPGKEHQQSQRVAAMLCFKTKSRDSKQDPELLLSEASDFLLLEELKATPAEELTNKLSGNPRFLTARNEKGMSALHQAVIIHRTDLVKALLKAGADVSLADNYGRTPAEYASTVPMLKALGMLSSNSTVITKNTQMQGAQAIIEHLSKGAKLDAAQKSSNSTSEYEDFEENTRNEKPVMSATRAEQLSMFSILHDIVDQAQGADEVFDLFDMDGDGVIDIDEFEGSMRALLSIQSANDDRLDIVRSISKALMASQPKSCTREHFMQFFDLQDSSPMASARSTLSQSADNLVSVLSKVQDLSINSPILEVKSKLESFAQENLPIDVVRQAWLKSLAAEERSFENTVEKFVAHLQEHYKEGKWPTKLNLKAFAEIVQSFMEPDEQFASSRFVERLCQRFHLANEDIIVHQLVMQILTNNGIADEELIGDANDRIIQHLLSLIKKSGHGALLNDFKSVSRRLFEKLDANDSGMLDQFEFSSGMRSLGVMDASSVKQLFRSLDVDKDGRISVEEFVLYIEKYIFRKQAALDSVLSALREQSRRLTETSTRRGLTRRELLEQKLETMQAHLHEATKRRGDLGFFRKKRSKTLHEVNWGVLISAPVNHASSENSKLQRLQSSRVSCYDEVDELLILQDGRSLRLGVDSIEMIYDCSSYQKYQADGYPDPLLVKVLAKLEASRTFIDRSAKKVQHFFRRNAAMKDARRVVAKQREYVKMMSDQRNGAVALQRVIRGKQARQRRVRLHNIRQKQVELIASQKRAATKIQTRVRGWLVRSDAMAQRETRQVKAATRIQAASRGFLLRSAEGRVVQREHATIVEAIQMPFRHGLVSSLTLDAPRLSKEILRLKLFLAPFDAEEQQDETQRKAPVYGLLAEEQQVKASIDVPGRIAELQKLMRSFGITDMTKEIPLNCLSERRAQKSVLEVLQATLVLNDEALISKMAFDLASAITDIHPIHDTSQVGLALFRALQSDPPKEATKDSIQAIDNARFKSFRYLQRSATKSYAWVETKAKRSQRIFTRSLELESFQNEAPQNQNDEILSRVHALALACAELDVYGLTRAFLDSPVTVEQVETDKAILSAAWNSTKYQLTVKLNFSKKRKVTAGKGYEHVPARARCKQAELYSLLAVLPPTSGDSNRDPRVMKIDFSGVEVGESGSKTLERAVWMPPTQSKIFAQRVYLQSSNDKRGTDLDSLKAAFQRVRWIGKLITSPNTAELVEVDAWRLTDHSTGGLQLRLTVAQGVLGWFSIQECKSILRLYLCVSISTNDLFERVSKMLSPFEETSKILTGLLLHVRERVESMGDARRVFLRHGFDSQIPHGALLDLLKRRLECLVFLRTVEGIQDAEEMDELLNMFLDLFPDPLSLDAWENICNPPAVDALSWLSQTLHKNRTAGIMYLRAKFRSIGGNSCIVPYGDVQKVLCDYLEDAGLVPEMLEEVDWQAFRVGDKSDDNLIDCKLFFKALEDAMIVMESRHVTSPISGASGDEALPINDEESVENPSDSENIDYDQEITEEERACLLDELVDSEDEADVWGAEFFRDQARRSALAELRFRVFEYSNPDALPGGFDLEKVFRVFDQDRTGLVDADEFQRALEILDVEEILPNKEAIRDFISIIDKDGDGRINLDEFVRMMGPHQPLSLLKRLSRPPSSQIIRWAVELFVADLGTWIPGVAHKYRPFDNAVQIELKAHGNQFEAQDIGFLQLDDYPLLLRRNMWSGKPWGREPLWKRVHNARSVRNTKSYLQEKFSSGSKASTSPTTASSSASSFLSVDSETSRSSF